MLFLYSATLIIKGREVVYDLSIDQETGTYFMKPVLTADASIYPPSFGMMRKGSDWEFDSIIPREIKEQAIEEVNYYLNFKSSESS